MLCEAIARVIVCDFRLRAPCGGGVSTRQDGARRLTEAGAGAIRRGGSTTGHLGQLVKIVNFDVLALNAEQTFILETREQSANGLYRQTSISVGDGVRAAMQIYRKLKEIY